MAKLQGTIYLGEQSRQAVEGLKETRRREVIRDGAREVESRKEWLERQDRYEERHALEWLRKSDVDVDRDKVLRLFEKPLRRYWARCGYSQKWIDNQFC